MEIIVGTEYTRVKEDKYMPFGEVEISLREFTSGKNYGEGVKKYFYILKIFPPGEDSQFFFNEFKYSPRSKRVLISPLIKDYNQFADNPNEDLRRRIIVESFVEGLDKFRELKIKDFDKEKFIEDVKRFFYEKGWLQNT